VQPNLPEKYFSILNQNSITYTKGMLPVGKTYPGTARYNTLVTGKFIIQNPEIAEPSIAKLNPNHKIIAVKQGYVQCNLLALPNETFITSDRGIEKVLKQYNMEVLFVDPSCIILDGFEHGFFGGACGLIDNTLFICGSLSFLMNDQKLKVKIKKSGVQIIELYNGPLLDIGTILFLKT